MQLLVRLLLDHWSGAERWKEGVIGKEARSNTEAEPNRKPQEYEQVMLDSKGCKWSLCNRETLGSDFGLWVRSFLTFGAGNGGLNGSSFSSSALCAGVSE